MQMSNHPAAFANTIPLPQRGSSMPVFQGGRFALVLLFSPPLGFVQAKGEDAAHRAQGLWAGLGAGHDLCLLRTLANSSGVAVQGS